MPAKNKKRVGWRKRPAKKVMERFNASVMAFNCGTAILDVGGWTYRIPTKKLQEGDRVRVQVTLLKRGKVGG